MPTTSTRHATDTEELDNARERRVCLCGWHSASYEPEPEPDSPEGKLSRSVCPQDPTPCETASQLIVDQLLALGFDARVATAPVGVIAEGATQECGLGLSTVLFGCACGPALIELPTIYQTYLEMQNSAFAYWVEFQPNRFIPHAEIDADLGEVQR